MNLFIVNAKRPKKSRRRNYSNQGEPLVVFRLKTISSHGRRPPAHGDNRWKRKRKRMSSRRRRRTATATGTPFLDKSLGFSSDAEFAVHPILRSLIKSKSAYTIQRQTHSMKASKTSFEVRLDPGKKRTLPRQISLAKMLDSTTKQIEQESELEMVMPCPMQLDQKWPEPDSPKPKSHRRFQVCPSRFTGWNECPCTDPSRACILD